MHSSVISNDSSAAADSVAVDPLFDERETSEYLKIAIKTLQRWRCEGGGPVFCRIGTRAIRYQRSDLDAFKKAGRRTSTSDPGAAAA